MLLKDRVLNFIKPMQNRQTIEYFVNENSFWFAYLLKGRFEHAPYNAMIVYDDSDPDNYYFAVKINLDFIFMLKIADNKNRFAAVRHFVYAAAVPSVRQILKPSVTYGV